MDTAFVIGNGESRNIFPIETLKGKGHVWGCNAIYRDYPKLCDHIVAVNPPMYEELAKWHNNGKESPQIHGLEDTVNWNWVIKGDKDTDVPDGLKLYKIWRGGTTKNGGKIRTVEGGMRVDIFDHDENSEYDFSEHDCSLCELPEHSQNHIIEDIQYAETDTKDR